MDGDFSSSVLFLSTPLREGRRVLSTLASRRCEFLSTPLREGRRGQLKKALCQRSFIHAPAPNRRGYRRPTRVFLSTPLREGRPVAAVHVGRRYTWK